MLDQRNPVFEGFPLADIAACICKMKDFSNAESFDVTFMVSLINENFKNMRGELHLFFTSAIAGTLFSGNDTCSSLQIHR